MSQARKSEIADSETANDDPNKDLLLPYDPEDWERRLSVARERRSAILAQRLTEMRTAQAGAPIPRTTHTPSRPVEAAAPVPYALATEPPLREHPEAVRSAPDTEPEAPPPDRRGRLMPPRLRPVAAAFVLGLAVGLPLSIPDLRGRPSEPGARVTEETSPIVSPTLGPPVTLGDPARALSLQAPAIAAVQGPDPATAPFQPSDPSPAPTIITEPSEPEPAQPTMSVVPTEELLAPVAVPAGAEPVQAVPESARPSTPAAGAQDPPAVPPPVIAEDAPADTTGFALVAIDPPGVLPIHVFVPSGVATDRIAAVADLLRAAGVAANTPTRARFSISETNVRFYHAEDAARAGRIAEALDAEARDFTDFRPSPPPGLIEVWLAGKAPRAAGGRAKAHPDDRPNLLQALSRLLSGNSR